MESRGRPQEPLYLNAAVIEYRLVSHLKASTVYFLCDIAAVRITNITNKPVITSVSPQHQNHPIICCVCKSNYHQNSPHFLTREVRIKEKK